MTEFPRLICDVRVGCVAVYPPPKLNCLDGQREHFLYYARGEWVEGDQRGHWTVPDDKVALGHLFAAAPELLEAAEWLLERAGEGDGGWLVPPSDAQEATRRFQATIAKARGEQS